MSDYRSRVGKSKRHPRRSRIQTSGRVEKPTQVSAQTGSPTDGMKVSINGEKALNLLAEGLITGITAALVSKVVADRAYENKRRNS